MGLPGKTYDVLDFFSCLVNDINYTGNQNSVTGLSMYLEESNV